MRRRLAIVALAVFVAATPAGSAEAGTTTWTRQFGTALEDVAGDVAAASTGLYVAGVTRGALPGQSSAGNWDPYLRRYDANGNELWTRQFGTPDYAAFEISGGVAANAAGAYIVGATPGALPGQPYQGFFDAFVRKYDAGGDELWTREFGSSQIDLLAADDQAEGVAVDASGVYVIGVTSGTLTAQANQGSADAFIRKYDHDGTELWTRQFGSSADDSAAGVAVDATGVYVVGQTLGALPGQTKSWFYEEAFIRKYDLDGNELWTRQFTTAEAGGRAHANDVVVGAAGVHVVGETHGALPGQTSAGNPDAFIRTYDVDGNELWTHQFGTPRTEFAEGVGSDAAGVSVVGETGGTLPGQGAAGRTDAFIRRYDVAGNHLWTRQFGSSGGEGARDAVADGSDVYVVGDTEGALPGQTNAGQSDAFVLKIFDGPEDSTPPLVTCDPAPSFLLNAPGFVTATLSDSGSGPVATSAGVLAPTASPGAQSATVIGQDWAGNLATASCPYRVTYNFSFQAPIEVPPTLNIAKAGTTVPIVWRVSGDRFAPVTNSDHFRSVTVRPVACDPGAPTDPIDTTVKRAGLQSLGGGLWQYGWKTKGTYKKTCQEVTVNLADDVTTRIALFRFD